MKYVSMYALAAAAAVAAVAGALALVLPAGAVRAVAWAGVLAWVVQVATFAPLYAVRRRGNAFFAALGGGTLVRLAALGVLAAWLWRSGALPLAPALLGFAGFLFLLLLLEPVFFRLGLRSE